jgi:pectin methylesterase-like acyl-CoA thioesterase
MARFIQPPVSGGGSADSIQYSQTLIVDPDGNDTTGNGAPNNPFQTIQAAHDYAEENIDLNKRVIVKINAGTYIENLLITRPRINFVGLIEVI